MLYKAPMTREDVHPYTKWPETCIFLKTSLLIIGNSQEDPAVLQSVADRQVTFKYLSN